ncbi:MAG: response regulator [Isosphaeraceae bacterium]
MPQARPPLEIPEPPQSVAIDPELRDTFLEEAGDLFERVESLVLSLVADQPQPDPLHEIGRCLHTLKGAAGSVDLTQLAMLIHGMEEHLEAAAGRPSAAVIDQLHRLLEYVEGLFHALRRGHAPAAAEPISTAVAPLPPVSVVNDPPRSAAPSPVHPNVSSVEAPGSDPRPITIPGKESASGDGPVRISSERVDALMDIASELISRRGLWSAQADAMRELATLLRTCRTRLTATIDRIRDLHVENLSDPTRTGGSHGTNDLHESIRRLTEQADDLVELIESTQAASKPLADNSDALARQTLQLWESLQAIRIVPVRGLFQRLMRVVHDAARVEGRQVEVVTVGDETGLDRAVQDKAFEPLLHVVRNAVCHGIESPEDRRRMGKPPTGRITLEASRSGNTMVLSVQDDGRGLDYDAIAEKGRRLGLIGRDDRPSDDRLSALIFQSGFSTRDAANAVAGRGVGMDVVSQEAAKLHGSVSLVSQQGKGMRLSIALPARLALEQSMVLRVDRQAFALPVELVELAEPFDPEVVDRTTGIPRIPMRNESVPLVVARDAFGFPPAALASCSKVLLIRAENQPLAVLVDSLDGTRELVIKPLGPLLSGHPLISGVSLSVTGEVIFAVNPAGLALWQREGGRAAEATRRLDHPAVPVILVVDDSISVRKVVARQLRQLGYHVEEVNDGLEALGKIRHNAYGLVISDLEMPRMDGFELLAELSRLNIATSLPVLAASTRSDPETRRRILALGAREFVAKPIDPDDLAVKVHALLRPAVAASPTARGA